MEVSRFGMTLLLEVIAAEGLSLAQSMEALFIKHESTMERILYLLEEKKYDDERYCQDYCHNEARKEVRVLLEKFGPK